MSGGFQDVKEKLRLAAAVGQEGTVSDTTSLDEDVTKHLDKDKAANVDLHEVPKAPEKRQPALDWKALATRPNLQSHIDKGRSTNAAPHSTAAASPEKAGGEPLRSQQDVQQTPSPAREGPMETFLSKAMKVTETKKLSPTATAIETPPDNCSLPAHSEKDKKEVTRAARDFISDSSAQTDALSGVQIRQTVFQIYWSCSTLSTCLLAYILFIKDPVLAWKMLNTRDTGVSFTADLVQKYSGASLDEPQLKIIGAILYFSPVVAMILVLLDLILVRNRACLISVLFFTLHCLCYVWLPTVLTDTSPDPSSLPHSRSAFVLNTVCLPLLLAMEMSLIFSASKQCGSGAVAVLQYYHTMSRRLYVLLRPVILRLCLLVLLVLVEQRQPDDPRCSSNLQVIDMVCYNAAYEGYISWIRDLGSSIVTIEKEVKMRCSSQNLPLVHNQPLNCVVNKTDITA